MRGRSRHSSTNESGPACLEACDQSPIKVGHIVEHLVLADRDGGEQDAAVVSQAHLGREGVTKK